MKTLKQFEKQSDLGFDEYLQPMDRIDEALYFHIVCGYVAPNYENNRFGQNGECSREIDGIMYYETCMHVNDKFYYLGECPSMNPNVYYS